MAKVEIKATVEKVVRQNGKQDAQVVITLPVSAVADFPLGAVMLTIQPLQSAMFGNGNKPIRGANKKGYKDEE